MAARPPRAQAALGRRRPNRRLRTAPAPGGIRCTLYAAAGGRERGTAARPGPAPQAAIGSWLPPGHEGVSKPAPQQAARGRPHRDATLPVPLPPTASAPPPHRRGGPAAASYLAPHPSLPAAPPRWLPSGKAGDGERRGGALAVMGAGRSLSVFVVALPRKCGRLPASPRREGSVAVQAWRWISRGAWRPGISEVEREKRSAIIPLKERWAIPLLKRGSGTSYSKRRNLKKEEKMNCLTILN
ncbi:sterile alpha motif domain-containing protein 1-like [Chroicocephalus ridibundus]|uniref:sterile alpha motif domain-containing protein 1-like n=1 Tax=Chroicocephalus ridibundus TaxID=1192867 RepID=UPI002FDEF0A6